MIIRFSYILLITIMKVIWGLTLIGGSISESLEKGISAYTIIISNDRASWLLLSYFLVILTYQVYMHIIQRF